MRFRGKIARTVRSIYNKTASKNRIGSTESNLVVDEIEILDVFNFTWLSTEMTGEREKDRAFPRDDLNEHQASQLWGWCHQPVYMSIQKKSATSSYAKTPPVGTLSSVEWRKISMRWVAVAWGLDHRGGERLSDNGQRLKEGDLRSIIEEESNGITCNTGCDCTSNKITNLRELDWSLLKIRTVETKKLETNLHGGAIQQAACVQGRDVPEGGRSTARHRVTTKDTCAVRTYLVRYHISREIKAY